MPDKQLPAKRAGNRGKGRPKGSKNKKTLIAQEVFDKNPDPLERLFEIAEIAMAEVDQNKAELDEKLKAIGIAKKEERQEMYREYLAAMMQARQVNMAHLALAASQYKELAQYKHTKKGYEKDGAAFRGNVVIQLNTGIPCPAPGTAIPSKVIEHDAAE